MNTVKDMVKDMVKDNKRVLFKYYRDEQLWYSTECAFLFPVPISDVGDATFHASDKALLFMRWIRKYKKECEESGC